MYRMQWRFASSSSRALETVESRITIRTARDAAAGGVARSTPRGEDAPQKE